MEQWKLPELRQSVGYQLHRPGGDRFQPSAGPSHAPIPTSTPSPSGADRNTNDFSLTSLGSNRIRHATIKKKYRIVKSRYQARLDQHELKNRALATRLEELKQCSKYLVSLHGMQKKITAAESYGKGLETEVRIWERAVNLFDLETLPGFGEGDLGDDEEDEREEDKNEEEEDEGESEEEEVDATEDSEEDSGEEADAESNCPDDEGDY